MLATRKAIAITCERDGKGWLVCLGDLECVIEDSVGMSYLSVLLSNPGYEVPALELAGGPDTSWLDDGRRSEQPFLDEAAVRSYRARLSTLRAEIDEYEAMNDPVRSERARVEHDWLVSELISASGLSGRQRRFSDNEERARVSVGKAIRRAINRIASVRPEIGEALRTTVHTGMRCVYHPRRATTAAQSLAAQSLAAQPLAARASVGAGRVAPAELGEVQPLAARASVGASRAARIAG